MSKILISNQYKQFASSWFHWLEGNASFSCELQTWVIWLGYFSCLWPLLVPAQPLPCAFPAPGGYVGTGFFQLLGHLPVMSSASCPFDIEVHMWLFVFQPSCTWHSIQAAVWQLLQRIFGKMILLIAHLRYLKVGWRIFSLALKCMLKIKSFGAREMYIKHLLYKHKKGVWIPRIHAKVRHVCWPPITGAELGNPWGNLAR